jgi:bifunctional non-homologous end joining protein LigD
MKVEDHPFEYGEFEGVIPEGYGAGIVMLWDRGTWTPESEDIDAALKKGDLKFTLDGYKLKGSWVLVRTGGRPAPPSGERKPGRWGDPRGDARSWLLIKHRDDWAGDVDITEFAPLSIKSEGDFADILAQDDPDIWISHRPAEGGETGAMFRKIVERALALRQGRASREAPAKKRTAAAAKKKATKSATSRVRKTAARKRTR